LILAIAPVAAACLALLLIALFPANIRAAREGLTIRGRPATALPLRTLLQRALAQSDAKSRSKCAGTDRAPLTGQLLRTGEIKRGKLDFPRNQVSASALKNALAEPESPLRRTGRYLP